VFHIITRWFWLAFIATTFANAAVWWKRAQPYIEKRPELEPGYRQLIRNFLFFSNIPWIVMGVGILGGAMPGIFHYFNAKSGPFAIAWYASIVMLQVLLMWWIFFRRGAETLVEYPGYFNNEISPRTIKTFVLLTPIGLIIYSVTFFTANIRLPP